MLTTARLTALFAAIIWVGGFLIALRVGGPFSGGNTIYGATLILVGLAMAPLARALGGSSGAASSSVLRALGLVACAALALSGGVLVAGWDGSLGSSQAVWIPSISDLALAALAVWILVVSFATWRATFGGVAVFGLGMLAAASFLVLDAATLITFHLYLIGIPFLFLGLAMYLLCLPAWLVALAITMRAGESGRGSPSDANAPFTARGVHQPPAGQDR